MPPYLTDRRFSVEQLIADPYGNAEEIQTRLQFPKLVQTRDDAEGVLGFIERLNHQDRLQRPVHIERGRDAAPVRNAAAHTAHELNQLLRVLRSRAAGEVRDGDVGAADHVPPVLDREPAFPLP